MARYPITDEDVESLGCRPISSSAILQEIDLIDKKAAEINELLSALGEQLRPITIPPKPVARDGDLGTQTPPSRPACSPVLERLEHISARLDFTCNTISRLGDSIQL